MDLEQINADDLLQQAGLKRTPVRVGVMRLLAEVERPLAAPEILDRLPTGTDTVTVYRTLNTLTAKKMLHRVQGDDRVWRYALSDADNKSRHAHAHFVCDECGRVECLKETTIPRSLLSPTDIGDRYKVKYAEIVVHGVCGKCSDHG